MKVYVLQDFDGYIYGVFSTEVKANYWVKRNRRHDGLAIAERDLDSMDGMFYDYLVREEIAE